MILVSFLQSKVVPGSGSYQMEGRWTKSSKITKSPNAVIGKALKFSQKVPNMPGPGDYQVLSAFHSLSNKKQSNAFSIGKAEKMKTQRHLTQIPGPGQYNSQIPQNLKFSQKYSFSKSVQREKIAKNQGPSPFEYDPKYVKQSSPRTKFGTDKRAISQSSKDKIDNFPSVGAYKLEQVNTHRMQPKYSFGKQQKFAQQKKTMRWKTEVPGPSSYQSENTKKQSIVGGKIQQAGASQNLSNFNKRVITNIGPGSYNTVTSFYKKAPQIIIGQADRSSIQQKKKCPGPGHYNIQIYSQKEKAGNNIIFAKSKRQSIDKDQAAKPGPGSYNVSYQMQNSPHAVLTGKNFYTKIQQVPGPQNYKPEYQKLVNNAGKFSIGRQKRMSQKLNQTPGPGQYSSQKNSPRSKCYSFTKQKREQYKDSTVGHGRYEVKSIFSKKLNESLQKAKNI